MLVNVIVMQLELAGVVVPPPLPDVSADRPQD
jgi:hypothetical protein